MRTFNTIALLLLIVGGINWLLVGLFQYDLVVHCLVDRAPSAPASSIRLSVCVHCTRSASLVMLRMTTEIQPDKLDLIT